jgi:hypothetical protein
MSVRISIIVSIVFKTIVAMSKNGRSYDDNYTCSIKQVHRSSGILAYKSLDINRMPVMVFKAFIQLAV